MLYLRFEECAPHSECVTTASIAKRGPCHHLEAGPAVETDNAFAYPHVLTKKSFAPLPISLQSSAVNAGAAFFSSSALHNSRNSTAASPARFVFVVGLEGTGHHLLAQFFKACAHEIDTAPMKPVSRMQEGGLGEGARSLTDERRPFCRSLPYWTLWGRDFDSGLMGSRQAPAPKNYGAPPSNPYMTAWAIENIRKNLPGTINALVKLAAAPEAARRFEH
jgi:hypothetical protein